MGTPKFLLTCLTRDKESSPKSHSEHRRRSYKCALNQRVTATESAHVIGCTLLKHTEVAAEISRLTGRTEKKSQLTAERVIAELSNIAFFDPRHMYDEHGKLLAIKDMPEDTRRAIAGVEEHLTKGTKVRLSSKLGSLELAAKLLGMVKEQQTAAASGPDSHRSAPAVTRCERRAQAIAAGMGVVGLTWT